MGRKSVLCPCGAEFPLPEIRVRDLHCPKCGEAIWFRTGDTDGRLPGNEEIRKRPPSDAPLRNLFYRRVLPALAGVLIAGTLLTRIVSSSSRKSAEHVGRAQPAPRPDDSARASRALLPVRPERKPDPPPAAPDVRAAPPPAVIRETPSTPAPVQESKLPAATPFPAALLSDLKRKIEALPGYYLEAMPYRDRSRGDFLLRGGEGTNEDAQFLSGRFRDLLVAAKSEQDAIAARVSDLEAKIAETAASTDTLVCRDRSLDGVVLEEAQDFVKIQARYGVVSIPRAEILRIEKGKGPLAEFLASYRAARGRKEELFKLLMRWKDKKLAAPQELAAAATLLLDPGDETSRGVLGLPRNPYAGVADPETISLQRAAGARIESSCRDVATDAARNEVLVDALAEMRLRTETLAYPLDFTMPRRFSDVAVRLKDPLAPDWNGMTREQAFALGSWWGTLPADERGSFLAAYGVWCARVRWSRTPK